MHIPDDPLYYEKFYFTPGDTGFRAWKTKYAHDRRADLLGSVVPRRRAADRAAGRRDPLLPHRHRLAPEREGGVRPRPARLVGADPAQPRRRQRLLRLRAQPHRPRAGARRRRQAGRAPTASSSGASRSSPRPTARSSTRASVDREEVLVVPTATSTRVEFSRTHWPFLRDRRVDAYGDLTKRFVDAPPGADRRGDRPHAPTPSRRARSWPARRPSTATRFPPNGSVTPARGSAGRGPKASRSPASTIECIENVVGVIARHRAVRAGAPQRAERQLRAHRPRSVLDARGVPAPARALSPHPHQRMLDPRSRAGVRAADAARPHRDRRSSTGASTPGAASTRRTTPTTRCRRGSPRSSACRCSTPDIVMEGGAVDFNGAGTVLTTTSCLLQQEPQPGVCRRRRSSGTSRTTTASGTSSGSARASTATTPTATSTTWRASSASGTIVIGMEDDPRDANYHVLRENRRALDRAARPGRPPVRDRRAADAAAGRPRGQRLPATYMNFYFVNGALLVPTFGDRARDRAALAPAAARAAPTAGDRRRLPRAHLGTRRDPLPDAAAAGG